MAQTITKRAMRVVGTTTGSSPYVQQFPSGEAVTKGDVLWYEDGDGKVYKEDGTSLVNAGTDDTVDLSLHIFGGAGAGPLCGLALGTATAANVSIPVALFHPANIFEANLVDINDGSGTSTEVWAIADRGAEVAIIRLDSGVYAVTTLEGTERVGNVLDGGYGYAGETKEAGHGVIGDTDVRVRFIVGQAALESGQTFLRV